MGVTVTALILLAVLVIDLARRVRSLEAEVSRLRAQVLTATDADVEVGPSPTPQQGGSGEQADAPDHAKSAATAGAGQSTRTALAARARNRVSSVTVPRVGEFIGRHLLPLLGGVLVLAGVGFLLALAISNGWIGELGRTLLAFGIAAGLFALGAWRAYRSADRRADTLAGALLATGCASAFFAATVGARVYDVVPIELGLLSAAATGIAGAAAAIRWQAQPVAWIGLTGALASPLLLDAAPEGATLGIVAAAYVAALATATLAGWSWLFAAAALITAPQLAAWADGTVDSQELFVVASAVTVSWLVLLQVAQFVHADRAGLAVQRRELGVTFVSAGTTATIIVLSAAEADVGQYITAGVLGAVALLQLAAAGGLTLRSQAAAHARLYAVVAAGFLVLCGNELLDGGGLAAWLAVEAAALWWVSRAGTDRLAALTSAGAAAAAVVVALGTDARADEFLAGWPDPRFAALALGGITVAAAVAARLPGPARVSQGLRATAAIALLYLVGGACIVWGPWSAGGDANQLLAVAAWAAAAAILPVVQRRWWKRRHELEWVALSTSACALLLLAGEVGIGPIGVPALLAAAWAVTTWVALPDRTAAIANTGLWSVGVSAYALAGDLAPDILVGGTATPGRTLAAAGTVLVGAAAAGLAADVRNRRYRRRRPPIWNVMRAVPDHVLAVGGAATLLAVVSIGLLGAPAGPRPFDAALAAATLASLMAAGVLLLGLLACTLWLAVRLRRTDLSWTVGLLLATWGTVLSFAPAATPPWTAAWLAVASLLLGHHLRAFPSARVAAAWTGGYLAVLLIATTIAAGPPSALFYALDDPAAGMGAILVLTAWTALVTRGIASAATRHAALRRHARIAAAVTAGMVTYSASLVLVQVLTTGGGIDQTAQLALTLFWAGAGTALLLGARFVEGRDLGGYGMTLLLAAATKVSVLDTAQLDAGKRVLAFMGVGLLLLGAGWLASSTTRRGQPLAASDETTASN